MAEWVTHLWIADKVMKAIPELKRHEFCVGNITPDCNVENEDWTQFIPSREVTHWMGGGRKNASDCDRFFIEYIGARKKQIKTVEEYSFLLGYYAHLISDAELQRTIRDEDRVAAVWRRINAISEFSAETSDMPENWDSVKRLLNEQERMKDVSTIEAEYLEVHPDSGWMYEGGIREPLMIQFPKMIRPGSFCEVPVTTPDLYPTLLQLAGLPMKPRQHVDGVSLLPLLVQSDEKQQASLERDTIFWHFPHYGNAGGTPAAALRQYQYKLIRFFEDDRVELYDLKQDIAESQNIADQHPELVAKLSQQLNDWLDDVAAKIPQKV